MHPAVAIVSLWSGFALSWLVAAAWSSPAKNRLGLGSEAAYRIVLLLGGIVLFVPAHGYHGAWRFWTVTRDQAWACVGLIALGFVFAWWARLYLGRLMKARLEEGWLAQELGSETYDAYRRRVPMLMPFWPARK